VKTTSIVRGVCFYEKKNDFNSECVKNGDMGEAAASFLIMFK